jgi:hypothetical protein
VPVVFDDTSFPLVEIRFEPPVCEGDIDVFCEKMRALAHGGRRYASVFNTHGVLDIDPQQRRRMTALQLELAAASARVVVVACLAFSNQLTRGVVTAINWSSPPSFPQRSFDSVAEARVYAVARLRAEGLEVTAAASLGTQGVSAPQKKEARDGPP